MSSQPSMEGHLAVPLNGILFTNVPPMSSHLRLMATFSVSQGLLLIAGSTVFQSILILKKVFFKVKYIVSLKKRRLKKTCTQKTKYCHTYLR